MCVILSEAKETISTMAPFSALRMTILGPVHLRASHADPRDDS
jgi:hypothetical protein